MKDILLKSSLIKKIDHEKSILRTETHLHLYGCLDAAGLYDIGKDRYLNFSDRMDWFATEYEKVNGIRPDYRKWWASSQGFDDFRETFEFTAPGTFDKFQSKFNLLIALNPPHFDDLQLAKRVLTKDQELACLREYRTFVPHYLDERSREKYLLNLLQVTKDFSQSRSGFRPLLALSLMRTNSECHAIYDWLTSFTNKHPWTVDFITGIDFCGSEVGHPPEDKISFLAQLNKDNESRTRPWGVLYHVGEMWDHMSLASSARWVLQAALQGITRLGHAMALGVEPSAVLGKVSVEPLAEFARHEAWLHRYSQTLSGFGYTQSDQNWYLTQGKKSVFNEHVRWDYHSDLCENIRTFQNALLPMTRALNPIIEVCLTSNLRIGQLAKVEYHPIKRFMKAGIRLTISTDDPGIFAIGLFAEESLLKSSFSLGQEDLNIFELEARNVLRT